MDPAAARVLLTIALAALAAGGCSRDRASGPDRITAEEEAAFRAPADSTITVDQVNAYLGTARRQFELLATGGEFRVPSPDDGAASQDSTPKRRPSAQRLWREHVDAALVHAARDEGRSPAEMWYVRARLSAVSGHVLATRLHGQRDQAAALFRQQAADMRGLPGVTDEQIEAMLRAAEAAERQEAPPVPPAVAANLAVLRSARPALGDSAWAQITSVATGAGIGDLALADSSTRARALAAFERLHARALNPSDRSPD